MPKMKDHLKKNKLKYSTASIIAVVITVLQTLGALAPLVCTMPFISDSDRCHLIGKAAVQSAKTLGTLDGDITLDEVTVTPITEEVDAGMGGL